MENHLKGKKRNAIFALAAAFLLAAVIFSVINQAGYASAQANSYNSWCIQSTCTSVPAGTQGALPQSCSSIGSCKPGTCVDSNTGTCSINIAKSACPSPDTFHENTGLNTGSSSSQGNPPNVPECNDVCCNFGGTNVQWMPSIQCKVEGGNPNGISNPQSCYKISTQYDWGACVSPTGSCVFEQSGSCPTGGAPGSPNDNTFTIGDLCTNPNLHTNCKPTTDTQCYNNNVYFVDSCGNIANVYDSSKVFKQNGNSQQTSDYWSYIAGTLTSSSGAVSVTCNGDAASGGNPVSCGLCNFNGGNGLSGSMCQSASNSGIKPDYGNYVCQSLTCNVTKDPYFPHSDITNRNFSYNGEAWCVYQGHVGAANYSNPYTPPNFACFDSQLSGYSDCMSKLQNSPSSTIIDAVCYEMCPQPTCGGEREPPCSGPPPVCKNGFKNYQDCVSGLSSASFDVKNSTCVQECSIPNYTPSTATKSNSYGCQTGLAGASSCYTYSASPYPPANGSYSSDAVGSYSAVQTCYLGNLTIYTSPVGGQDSSGYRQAICGENITQDVSGGEVQANPRPNNGNGCFSVPMESYFDSSGNPVSNAQKVLQDNTAACESLQNNGGPDCRIQSVNVDTYFRFDLCVPKYPQGQNLNPSLAGVVSSQGQNTCSIATQTCDAIFKKQGFGLLAKAWTCIANCNCLTPDFADQMNNLCVSVGDCGGYVNVKGTYSNGGSSGQSIGDMSSMGSSVGISTSNNEQINSGGGISNTLQKVYVSNIFGIANVITGNNENVPTKHNGGQQGGLGNSGQANVGSSGVNTNYDYAAGILNPPLIGWIGGAGTKIKVEVTFTCNPWTAPTSEADCSQCGKFGLPCTPYQCESLGASCFPAQNTVSNPEGTLCVQVSTTPPTIVFNGMRPSLNYSVAHVTSDPNVWNISLLGGGCIQEGSPINFSFYTVNGTGAPELSKCIWNYTYMVVPNTQTSTTDTGGQLSFSHWIGVNHFAQGTYSSDVFNFSQLNSISGSPYTLPYLSQLPTSLVQQVSKDENRGNVSLYIACESLTGHPNITNIQTLNFCISSQPDNIAATIQQFNPPSGSYLPYGATSASISLLTDKAANCSYNVGSDENYSLMSPMICVYGDPGNPTSTSICSTQFTGLSASKENDIYFRCITHPWDNTGVADPVGQEYMLEPSPSPLNITSVTVNGQQLDLSGNNIPTIKAGGDSASVELDATTSGGTNSGNSVCSYNILSGGSGSSGPIEFFSDSQNGPENYHSQPGFNLQQGFYKIQISCTDQASGNPFISGNGNTASAIAQFNVQLITTPPSVTRIFNSGGMLNVVTNAPAECYYSTTGCIFDINGNSSVPMDSPSSLLSDPTLHTAQVHTGVTYYIKCQDFYNNTNPGCAAVVSPSPST